MLRGMELPVAWSVVLLVAGAWSLLVWPQFGRRILADPRARDAAGRPTRFLTVHVVLISVSMLLGALTALVGILALV